MYSNVTRKTCTYLILLCRKFKINLVFIAEIRRYAYVIIVRKMKLTLF